MICFGIAAVIDMLVLVEVWALIIGSSILLAFAPLPWTWNIFPGWGLRVLSACVKTLFLMAVLALGMTEAASRASDMASKAGSVGNNMSLMMQGVVESLIFVGSVYYLAGLMASLVTGGAGAAISAGETILAGIAAEGASQAARTGKAISSAGADGASTAAKAAADGAVKAMSKLQAMLMR